MTDELNSKNSETLTIYSLSLQCPWSFVFCKKQMTTEKLFKYTLSRSFGISLTKTYNFIGKIGIGHWEYLRLGISTTLILVLVTNHSHDLIADLRTKAMNFLGFRRLDGTHSF